MPAFITLFLRALGIALGAAPQIEELVIHAKDFITGLFSTGLINASTQDRVHGHIDLMAAAIKRGEVPPELTVEPDPDDGAAAGAS